MLLGIGLHAALAYLGAAWVINDGQASPTLGFIVPAIHGFRMPLFFLLSGFFTAMLWQRRGTHGLLKHRTLRIVIPFSIALGTILPATWHASSWASATQAAHIKAEAEANADPGQRAPTPDIWTVTAFGDMEGLSAYDADSELLNAPDPKLGVTPLGWAAIKDQPAAAEYLLSVGADPSARYADQNTPMHTACFFGRDEIARLLIDAGADLTLQSADGQRPPDALEHTKQITEFIANLVKVPIDFEEVSQGRELIKEMIAEFELAETADEASFIKKLQEFPFYYHLWFLWFLLILIAGFAITTSLLKFLPTIRLPGALFSAPLCFLWLVPLTMLPQYQMLSGNTVPNFGPDTSAGVIPIPHVLLYYAIFFGFGALMFAHRGADKKLGGLWYITLPLAVAVLPLGLILGYDAERSAKLVADESLRRMLMNLTQVLYAWLMTFGLLGLFEAVLAKERRWVRYLSDSSYWMYLAHLPLILVGQALLLTVEMSPIVKTLVLTNGSALVLLVTYALFIRYTPIGTLLNGKRTRPGRAVAKDEVVPAG